jgi:hypothetical protein
MKTTQITIITLVATALFLGGCFRPRNPEAEAAAVAAAEAWLALVDNGEYDTSWDEAASFFRAAVEKEKWAEMMQSFRQPFGANLSREVKSKRYRTSLPGAPDGEYVIIQFKSSFENKKSGLETVTPMLDQDGTWRVSGYYIK